MRQNVRAHPSAEEIRRFGYELLSGSLSRREILRRATVLGFSASTLATILAACGGSESESGSGSQSSGSGAQSGSAATTASSASGTPSSTQTSQQGSGEQRTIVVGAWTGTFAEAIRRKAVPFFKEQYNVEILVEEGLSSEQLAKMRTEKDNPKHTVMFIDENVIQIAKEEGLIEELTPDMVPNLANVYPEFIVADSHGVGVAVSWVTAYYNAERLETPPDSYEAWWNPDYSGRVAIPAITISPGIQFLVAAASLETGKPPREAQYEIDAGFRKLATLKDHWHSVYNSFENVMPQLASGEVWLAFGHSRIANNYILRGAPVKRALVKEGPFAGINGVCLVKGGPHPDVGAQLINYVLDTEMQLEFMTTANAGSVNRTVEPPADIAEHLPSGVEQVQEMNNLDWEFVNQNLSDWIDRFNQEITG